ncbi:CHAT domain-containing protein [Streptomyces chartreusis]|uniref:CHAT domain-containing protein n=1 Tax=Streptomyces chartreusis TaxID=1969 RepID=UPI00386FD73B|nr:CHAT domain-containing protein [Streptomyces chartreusis]
MIPLPPMVRRIQADRMVKQQRWAEAYDLYCAAASTYPERMPAAACWQDAAGMAGRLGRYSEQAECSRRSLSLLQDSVLNTPLVRRTRIRALLALAESLYRTGDLTGGAEVARRVYDLAAGSDPDFTAESFHRLGQALLLQGEIGGALTAFARAAETARAGGSGLEVAQELVSLGVAAAMVGDDPTARDCAAEAERLARASTDRQRTTVLASALSFRALVLRRERRDEEAVSHARESLSLLTGPVGRQDVAVLAQSRERLATCLLSCDEPEKAAEAIELLRLIHMEAVERDDALLIVSSAANLAGAHAVTDSLDEALAWAERSVDAARRAGQGPHMVAAALLNLGTVLQAREEHARAESRLLEAVTLWEQVRATTRSEVEHIDLLGEQAQVYRALQRCRVAGGDTDGALEAAERVRGLLLEQRLLTGRSTGSTATPGPRTAGQLSEQATRNNTVTVVYSLLGPARPSVRSGATTAYIWVITPDGTRRHHDVDLSAVRAAMPSAVAADGATIADGPGGTATAEAPETRLLRALSQGAVAPVASSRDSTPLAGRDLGRITDAELRLLADAFLRPVEDDLTAAGTRRLVVVPDGFLHHVPFNALPLKDTTPLADVYTVAVAPSARTGPGATAGTRLVRVSPSEALVVGNPDPPTQPLLPGLPAPVLRALPAAEHEARTVAALYGADALIGAEATREAVLARLPQARFAHFATHALAGEDVLRTPGVLCLSPSPATDPAGEKYAESAGGSYLRADDIQPLDLSGCPLVVLSACETGWGKPSPEGNLGLARAFLAAGVNSVVVALWPVDDSATADLMTAFHRHLVTGVNTGEALSRAMCEARQHHPRLEDWAGFSLLGSADSRLAPAARG